MKNKIIAGLAVVGGVFAPIVAFAAPLSTSTAEQIAQNAANDLGAVLSNLIPTILVIVVAFLAIGMGIRYVKRYISGRKF